LFGCSKKSLYSAAEDLKILQRYPNFYYRPGWLVEHIGNEGQTRIVEGRDAVGNPFKLRARAIVLAAGTLVSTRLALQALDFRKPVSMQFCATAAFMLWVATALGACRCDSLALAQLSYTLSLDKGISGFGYLFDTTGIPVSEFIRYMPLRKRYGADFLGSLLSSCVVGNIFLPGFLSNAKLCLQTNGTLHIEGWFGNDVPILMRKAEKDLRRIFLALGAILLPMSFTLGKPGSDIHYASSLPMRANPGSAQTDTLGQLAGLEGVHVVDGASLPVLLEKSHTLTIMANADRVGRMLAKKLKVI
jgi:hypothetical protein